MFFHVFGLLFSKSMFPLFLRHPERKVPAYVEILNTYLFIFKNKNIPKMNGICVFLVFSYIIFHAFMSELYIYLLNFHRVCVELMYTFYYVNMPDVTFCEFSHVFNNHSCLKCCIFAKLAQTVCLINIHIDMPNCDTTLVLSADKLN